MVMDTPLDTARYRIFVTGPSVDKSVNPLVLEQWHHPISFLPLFDNALIIVSMALSVLALAKNLRLATCRFAAMA